MRMPTLFVTHGGGPWPLMDLPMMPASETGPLLAYLKGLGDGLPALPKALLVVSAHWERPVPTIQTAEKPPMLFDYYGFPEQAYQLSYPAPGAPVVAKRVRGLLQAAGFETAEDGERGFDHGVYVPLLPAFGASNIPTLQLSLLSSLHAETHIGLGRALAPLRDEGVLIVGSGNSYHNLRALLRGNSAAIPAGEPFDAWLQAAVTASPAVRDQQLIDWTSAPHARVVHPREEHLLPLHVAAGAAGEDRGAVAWEGRMGGAKLTAVRFG